MKRLLLNIFVIGLVLSQSNAQPIRLHPDNPHYFQYKGEPKVLVTSAEHYGAVLNRDFDYKTYLKTLHQDGMNYTRIFTGSYVERPGAFGIENNTLAPAAGSFLAPWKRVGETGLYQGERKFDLSRWNPKYFSRLKKFVKLARKYDIIVEVTFFSSIYTAENWERNPFNPGNNINIKQELDRKRSNTLDNGNLLKYQKMMVRKIVNELQEFGNVIYEIQNEPWADNPQKALRILKTMDPSCKNAWFKYADKASDASFAWQEQIAATIVETEKDFPGQHLIAQNYTNFKYPLEKVADNISILNFHYAWPEVVEMNYAWNRPISFDESGFDGSSDTTYLRQAWQFMLNGGAVFNNLDYSFFVEEEDGTGVNNAPGGGSATLRKQLKYLRDFIESFDFVKMQPDLDCIYHAPGLEWNGISEKGQQYALILHGNPIGWIKLNLPRGKYRYEWVSPFSGEIVKRGEFVVKNSATIKLTLPEFDDMIAVKIVR